MNEIEILSIREHPELKSRAARWFHEKWHIPLRAYEDSMEDCLRTADPVPRWYVAVQGEEIVGGLGVIENDFHDRKDLAPNVCAVYVEEARRGQGLAGRLLAHVCEEFAAMGVDTLYLLTDHVGFYERYGWEFFCMARGNGEEKPSRMYIHRACR